jgi:hypothetical protein
MASEKWFGKAGHAVMRGLVIVFVFSGVIKAQGIADFEDLSLTSQSYWNGSDSSGGFSSGGARFSNHYDTAYDSWDGFAYSNKSDTTVKDWAGSRPGRKRQLRGRLRL